MQVYGKKMTFEGYFEALEGGELSSEYESAMGIV